jgi:hypothetical protein
MLTVKRDYLNKDVAVTFTTKDGRNLHVVLDEATPEQLKLLKDNDLGEYVSEVTKKES